MPRPLSTFALLGLFGGLLGGAAHADDSTPAMPAPTEVSALDPDDGALVAAERVEVDADPGDQGIGATVGIAAGGRVTPGGLRITGHYLYQLSHQDWFDGTASFTFGGGDAACFRDRMDVTSCGHDFNDGNSVELAAGIRRMFAGRGAFRPYARVAVGLRTAVGTMTSAASRFRCMRRWCARAGRARRGGARPGRARARIRRVQSRARRGTAARHGRHGRCRVSPAMTGRFGLARRASWLVVAGVVIGAVALVVLPARDRDPLSTTTLVLQVTAGGKPVGARVLLFDRDGQPVRMGNIDLFGQRQGAAACAIAPDVIGSWDGLVLARGAAEVPVGADRCVPSPAIPYGRYKVWAWRGVEYERWEGEVDLAANRGRVTLAIPLDRAWVPHGALAADLHVHAHASNDSRLPNPQRVVAQVAAGIEVVALSDHNTNGDLDAEITALGLDDVVASIASNELSNDTLHLGVYPVRVDRAQPRGGSPGDQVVSRATVAQLFALARGLGERPILQVNHPRFRYTALFDSTRWNGLTWPPPFPLEFDAFEVLAGYSAANVPGDRRIDDSVRDLMTFVDRGHLVAPVGNSDTHDLNWVLDGTARSYVFADARRTGRFDESAFIAAIRDRRVVATTGPWIDLEVAPHEGATPTVGPGQSLHASGSLWVDVTVSQARFVRTERIRITAGSATGPVLAQTIDVPPGVRTFHWAGRVAIEPTDTWIAVTADGDTALPLELTGTYQRDKWKRAGVTPYAVASPILVDADGDGRWKRGAADVSLGDARR